ncbi:myocardin [Pelodytes ibericus]
MSGFQRYPGADQSKLGTSYFSSRYVPDAPQIIPEFGGTISGPNYCAYGVDTLELKANSHVIKVVMEERQARVRSAFMEGECEMGLDTDLYTLFRDLEKATNKELRLWWDIVTLEKYIEVQRIPRGLRLKKVPFFIKDDEKLETDWNSTLTECSMKLMQIIITYKKKLLITAQNDLAILDIKKEEIKENAKFDEFSLKLAAYKEKLEVEISTTKKDKFQRDRMDYSRNEVYQWKRRNFSKRQHQRGASSKSILRKASKDQRRVSFSGTETSGNEGGSSVSSASSHTGSGGPRTSRLERLSMMESDGSDDSNQVAPYLIQTKKNRRRKRRSFKINQSGPTVEQEELVANGSNIINLSNFPLNTDHVNVLSLGLSFSPTNHFNLFSTLVDVNRFVRKITLKKHFFDTIEATLEQVSSPHPQNSNTTQLSTCIPVNLNFDDLCMLSTLEDLQVTPKDTVTILTGLKPQSSFYPVNSRNHVIDAYQRLVEEDLVKLANQEPRHTTSHNLSKKEQEALKQRTDNSDIVIKNADKGGAVVIMTREYYMKEAYRQLLDLKTYRCLSTNPTEACQKELSKLLDFGGYTEMESFLRYVNNNSLNLHFTFEYKENTIAFLDLELSGNTINEHVGTTVFRKKVAVLQLRLQQRRNREHLVDQGIMPPLKNPAAFHEHRKNLDRAKTEDYLKHKIRNRPEKSDLVNMHILQDSATEASAQSAQMKLKRARLADDLNERIALRPGPLELVEKNIIPLESTVKEALKGNQVNFPKPVDAFAFEEDSSNDGLSPEQDRGEELQGLASASPQEGKNHEAASSPLSCATQNHASENEKDIQDASSLSNHSCSMHAESQLSPTVPVTAAVKSKSSMDSKNRHKKPKDIKPKVKKLKYHQYIPPDQKAEKSPPPMDSAYARLLQQQQLFLQLQILSQQQQQQHFNYPRMHHSHQLKQQNDQMVRNSNQSNTSSPSLSPVKTTFPGQPNVSSIKPGLLPANLDDLKVSELRQQLRIRGLPVSGTKTSLMERLRPFQDCSNNAVGTFGEITTVTFPVTPNNALSNYQTHASAGVLSNGFYQFGSTSSTPPISPASSDLSVSGSLPDTFSDGPMSSPQFGLHPSPIHLSAEESLMSSINSGSYQAELEGIDAEKDKMLVEKQKVINELTWKLQQEQRQVEELRLQLQKRKVSCILQDKQLPSQHFFGLPIKQENVSSCPFASKQTALKAQTNNQNEKLSTCGPPPMSCMMNNHCMEVPGQNSIMSSTFLSPQCSPQHSPLGTTNSPQHISLPPSPNNHYLLPVSPSTQGDGRSVSPHANNQIQTAQSAVNSICFPSSQNNMQPSFIDQSESKQNSKDGSSSKSPVMQRKMTVLQPSPQTGQKISIPCPNFPNQASAVTKQPPSYEDAVRQQITRSQQMDELLDVLIESGEMPANAKEEQPCGQQKLHQLNVPTGNSNAQTSNAHLPYENSPNSDSHLEVLLNSHSPVGRTTDMRLLKIGNGEPTFDAVIDGFPRKTPEEILPSREILDTSLSPMETQLSPSSAESTVLQHLSFTESPWETMEWLDLTPPSSATGLGSLTTSGPSIFTTDFLDDTDLNLNTAMDLHLEQW